MEVGHAVSEPKIPWWLNVKGVGESLRDRYQVPEKLTPNLLKLVSAGRDRRERVALKVAS